MGPTRTATTRGIEAYERLRADVLTGRFAPGEPLRLAVLTARYGVSTSVVREALARLAEQHLAVLAPNSGYRTAEVSREDLLDLTDLRVRLEGEALARSVERGDVAWEATVVAAHHVLERTSIAHEGGPGSTDAWADAHALFHEQLVAACGSPRLLALTRSLRDSAELYRQLSGAAPAAARRDIVAEHRELADLATGRRAAEAQACLGRHLRATCDLVLGGMPDEGPGSGRST